MTSKLASFDVNKSANEVILTKKALIRIAIELPSSCPVHSSREIRLTK